MYRLYVYFEPHATTYYCTTYCTCDMRNGLGTSTS
jgi:hypothetical protein